MKRQWILQLAGFIAAMLLFIFIMNTCAAQKETYDIVGMGATINDQPMFLPISTTAKVSINEEVDIITIVVSEDKGYLYLLTGIIGTENNIDYMGATFSAVDLNEKKYFISMRKYADGQVQMTVGDKDARAAFVLFLDDSSIDGMTAANE